MHNLRYDYWTPRSARLALVALLLLFGYGVFLNVSNDDHLGPKVKGEQGDIALYRAIVERMSGGESYYQAVGEEQHLRGYPTKPFLTWRLPTTAWIINGLGEQLAANCLLLLVVLAVLAWIMELQGLGLGRLGVVAGGLMVCSGLIIVLPSPSLYLHESWAATLIALSLPLQRRWWRFSVICGIGALAFRELALPFVLVMTTCAMLEGRWCEARWWVAGLGTFLIALAFHAWMVSTQIGPEAQSGKNWLALGGWGFVLAANLWNVVTIVAPGWFIALWMPLALLGAAAKRDALGKRLMLTVGGYSLAFLFVGRNDNNYWGIIYAPLVAVSLTFAPGALLALWRGACKGAGIRSPR